MNMNERLQLAPFHESCVNILAYMEEEMTKNGNVTNFVSTYAISIVPVFYFMIHTIIPSDHLCNTIEDIEKFYKEFKKRLYHDYYVDSDLAEKSRKIICDGFEQTIKKLKSRI